jgi:hypothetical protein
VAAAGRSLDWDNVTRLRRIGLRREWKGGRRLRTIARRADCKTGMPLENAHYLPASVTTTSPACSPDAPCFREHKTLHLDRNAFTAAGPSLGC